MDSPGPTTELCATELRAPAEPIAAASTTPLATNRVRAMVANNTMVRLISTAAFLQGSEVSSVGRLNSQRPLSVTCLAYLRIGTGVSLKWAIFVVTWAWLAGSELLRIPKRRSSQNFYSTHFLGDQGGLGAHIRVGTSSGPYFIANSLE